MVALGVFAGFAGKNIKKVLEHSKHLKEFEKYKMFIKNEDIINENVENGFDEALGIDLEAQNRRVEGIRTINPNNIDDYSYRDIKNILNDTECPRYDYGDTGTIENKVSKGIEKIKAKVKRR